MRVWSYLSISSRAKRSPPSLAIRKAAGASCFGAWCCASSACKASAAAAAERGSRWAARQTILICDVIADAPPGVPPPAVVRDFLATARAAPPELGLAGAAEIIERALDASAALSWRQAQAWLGLTG